MKWSVSKVVLRDGFKITRPNWESKHFWVMSKDGYERILCHNGTNASVHIRQTEADDWELWKEEESLSDKIVYLLGEGCVSVKQLKEAVKELEEAATFCVMKEDEDFMVKQIKKIFGAKLC